MPPRRRRQEEPTDLGAEIDAGPQRGERTVEEDDPSKPLGVSKDYRALTPRTSGESFRGMSPTAIEGWSAAGRGPTGSRIQAPRYFSDDVWKPADRGTDGIIAMQRALMLGGYLTPGQGFQWGSWSGPTVAAYTDLLKEANASGLTAEEQVEQAAMGMPNKQPGGGGGYFDPVTGEWVEEQFVAPPLELRTTNKADLKRIFQSVTQDRLGIAWAPEQIDELVEAFNWKEIQIGVSEHEQQVERMRQEFEGEEITDNAIITEAPPDPETFAMDQMEQRDPQAVEANTGMELLLSLIDEWGG